MPCLAIRPAAAPSLRFELVAPDQVGRAWDTLHRILNAPGQEIRADFLVRAADGSWASASSSTASVARAGEVTVMVPASSAALVTITR